MCIYFEPLKNISAADATSMVFTKPEAAPGFGPQELSNRFRLTIENRGNKIARWYSVQVYFPSGFEFQPRPQLGEIEGKPSPGNWTIRYSDNGEGMLATYQSDGQIVLFPFSPQPMLVVYANLFSDRNYESDYTIRYQILNDWGAPEEGAFSVKVIRAKTMSGQLPPPKSPFKWN